VFPSGFVKVRHFGFLSNRNRKKMVRRCRELLPASSRKPSSWLHKLRRAMLRPGRDRLFKRVEVDETYWLLNHIELIIIHGAERRKPQEKTAEGISPQLSCRTQDDAERFSSIR
jgi:hypothetical protein